jgi:two-component system response regulator HydG
MSVLTMGILLLALAGSLIFVRRITGPLAELARATKKIDKGELNVRVQVQGEDEVGTLAYSFNHMVSRVEEYTRRLEEQTMDLERAHHQTRTFCEVVHAIGALSSLDEIGSYLIKRIQNILKCVDMVLLVFSRNKDSFFALSAKGSNVQKDPWAIQTAEAALENLEKVTSTKRAIFKPPLVPDDFQAETPQVIVPLHYENELLGALIVACPEDCRCDLKELDVVSLILTQAAGVIRRALLQEEELNDLQGRIEITPEFCGIIGKDPKMQMIYKLIENIAHTDATALIQGESGTGKELVAQAIHQLSPRKAKPFIVINCSAYPATLLESELFGHEKGAFTGAIRQKSGRFEQAHGGTVFLDEIGEVPLSAQIKLLRVLQSRTFERLGGEQTLAVDIRILAATHKDLLQEVKNDHFREDLFYRLNVIPINLPPLRERRNDIPLLARHFLSRFSARKDEEIMEFSPAAMRLLLDYFWPGNVRELENSIEHAAVLAKGGEIVPTDLPAVLHSGTASPAQAGSLSSILAEHERKFLHVEMVEQEKKLLQKVLEESRWNKKLASQRLGISRSTLYEKLRKYQIIRPTTH